MGAFRIAKEELWITNHVLVNPCLRVHFKPKTVTQKCSRIHSCWYESYFGAYHGRYLQYFAVKPRQELNTSFPPHSLTVVWNETNHHALRVSCVACKVSRELKFWRQEFSNKKRASKKVSFENLFFWPVSCGKFPTFMSYRRPMWEETSKWNRLWKWRWINLNYVEVTLLFWNIL